MKRKSNFRIKAYVHLQLKTVLTNHSSIKIYRLADRLTEKKSRLSFTQPFICDENEMCFVQKHLYVLLNLFEFLL